MNALISIHKSNLIKRIRISSLSIIALGTLGLKISEASFGLINSILLARWLGPNEFGTYSIVMATVSLAVTTITLGLPMLAVRETASYAALKKWSFLKGLISSLHKCFFLSSTVTIIVVFSSYIIFNFGFPIKKYALFSALILTFITAFNILRSSILRGLHYVIISDIPDVLVKPFFVSLLLTIGYFFFPKPNAQIALNLQITASIGALILGLFFFHVYLPPQVGNASAKTLLKEWFFKAVPFFGIALIGMLDNNISILQIGYLSGPEQAGLFQAANRIVGLIIMGLIAVNMPLQPEFTHAWSTCNYKKAQMLTTDATLISTGIALICALLLIPFAEKILWLFGDQYIESAFALRILVFGQLFNAASGPCGLLLALSGHQKIVMLTIAMISILKLLIGWKLIPLYGVIGAATASSIGIITWNLIFIYFVSYKLRISTHIFHVKL